MLKNLRIIIPARAGSKGYPEKNRILFPYTANAIPKGYRGDTYVSSNDNGILEKALHEYNFICHQRPGFLCEDDTSMKPVLKNFVEYFKFADEDYIMMLYLTYPERTELDIKRAIDFFESNNGKSMLCRQEWKGIHPCLCMLNKDGWKGEQFRSHNLFQRQQYPSVFELSHFIFICQVGELENLNMNLYNLNTIFFPIMRVHDIDSKADFLDYLENNKGGKK